PAPVRAPRVGVCRDAIRRDVERPIETEGGTQRLNMAGGVPQRAPAVHAVVRQIYVGDVGESQPLGCSWIDEVRASRRPQPLAQEPPRLLLARRLRGLPNLLAAVIVAYPPRRGVLAPNEASLAAHHERPPSWRRRYSAIAVRISSRKLVRWSSARRRSRQWVSLSSAMVVVCIRGPSVASADARRRSVRVRSREVR